MVMHQIDENQYEEGILHFYKDKDGKIVKIPPSKYAEMQNSLPDICFAVKYPIKKLEEKKIPDLSGLISMLKESDLSSRVVHEGINCSYNGKVIEGPRYYGRPLLSKDKLEYNFSADSFALIKECDIYPIIFLRFAKPLANPESTELP
jgi:hypothetical protein